MGQGHEDFTALVLEVGGDFQSIPYWARQSLRELCGQQGPIAGTVGTFISETCVFFTRILTALLFLQLIQLSAYNSLIFRTDSKYLCN